jgi:hypothetical protein
VLECVYIDFDFSFFKLKEIFLFYGMFQCIIQICYISDKREVVKVKLKSKDRIINGRCKDTEVQRCLSECR